ncbi:tRNA lysidine(34) synthetase TilS [Branchiibius sp. NY16-3462-2]|uniref:tRNA lysidine(34) synthetase TilS n=1 Tax=Branchiibius sp. NY16-3462-2 TaxID=1807500 RepID=UPI000792F8A5|nr:tRNA lysidine(34) synthetase TilS [Branchiibius sp. NY16-3462-2]KYH46276.1 hypothetical protein AZH51_11735 [Branchiibius sp. NY16-3462-2]
MPGPDPAVAATRSAVRRVLDGAAGQRVIVACSGGADSLALAAAVGFEAPRLSVPAAAVVVDHGLQPGSDEVATRAARQCAELGLEPALVVRVQVAEEGTGPEDAARSARYSVLADAAGDLGAGAILLAHTRDDQAETVLLGLARGSGLRSISGMATFDPRRRLVRPFLDITRAQTEAACTAQGLTWWDDPHNDDPRYTRVRARQVLPALEEALGPGVVAGLSRTAALARSDADGLDQLAAAATAALGAPPWPVGDLSGLVEPVRRRVWRALFPQTAKVHIDGLERLLGDWHGQVGIDVPGGLRVSRRAGQIEVGPAPGRTRLVE